MFELVCVGVQADACPLRHTGPGLRLTYPTRLNQTEPNRTTFPLFPSAVWEPVLGLSVSQWAEAVAAVGMAAIRAVVWLFQAPFRACLQVGIPKGGTF